MSRTSARIRSVVWIVSASCSVALTPAVARWDLTFRGGIVEDGGSNVSLMDAPTLLRLLVDGSRRPSGSVRTHPLSVARLVRSEWVEAMRGVGTCRLRASLKNRGTSADVVPERGF